MSGFFRLALNNVFSKKCHITSSYANFWEFFFREGYSFSFLLPIFLSFFDCTKMLDNISSFLEKLSAACCMQLNLRASVLEKKLKYESWTFMHCPVKTSYFFSSMFMKIYVIISDDKWSTIASMHTRSSEGSFRLSLSADRSSDEGTKDINRQ